MSIETGNIQDRFKHLLSVISNERFLNMRGTGNEIPFFICPFKPEETLKMEKLQKQLQKTLQQNGISVLNINLYDLTIEILKKRDLWGRILEMEHDMTKSELLETLDGILDCKKNLVPAMAEKITDVDFDVLFVNGIGEVYPYIRTHNLLENLQSTAKDFPSVFFFPGTYTYSIETGAYLDLFERLHANKYYRAFNIYNFDV